MVGQAGPEGSGADQGSRRAAEALTYQRTKLYPENEAKAREGFIKAGIKIVDLTPEQVEEFRVATRPVWDKFMNQFPKELVQMVLDTQK